MKKILIAVMLAGVAMTAAHGSYAADKPMTAQQQKMKDCNAEAKSKELKGQERKDFMKTCLSSGKSDVEATAAPAPAAGATSKKSMQTEKMKTCNADAKGKGLKGDERKKFMSECLKG